MMQKMFELQKVSFEQSIQELKEQISGALDSLVANVDDLKERTEYSGTERTDLWCLGFYGGRR